MNVYSLIRLLAQFDPDTEVTILDGFNGSGQARALNYGPLLWDPCDPETTFEGNERGDYSDLDSYQDMPIVVMGYGCY